ncbi:MAG: paraquat-inducible protein A [Pseudomonadota bacterium]
MERQEEADRSRIEALNRRYLACPYCDMLFERPALSEGQRVKCVRCHEVILERKDRSLERTIALMSACLLLYCVAVSFPFLSMERSGLTNQMSVIDAVLVLWQNNMPIPALICGCFILLFPLIRIVLLLALGSLLHASDRTGSFHAPAFRAVHHLTPWTMSEIFMIGVIVSLVKVGKLADISIGPAFWAMAGLTVLFAMGTTSLCRDTVWSAIRRDS